MQEYRGEAMQKKNWTEWYFADEYQHCPICMVLAMTGVGKSTLLNAFAGQQFLPYSNLSCTVRETAILHWPGKKTAEAVIRLANTTWTVHDKIEQEIARLNGMGEPGGVLIRNCLQGLEKCKTPFLIQDIPGLEDAENPDRTERAKMLLSKMQRGLLIYVTKATLVGTDGELRCLSLLRNKLKNTPSLHWIVVLNGIDQCSQVEIKQAIRREQDALSSCGLPRKEIYPISALAALRFRQKLAGLPMDKESNCELRKLRDFYYWFLYDGEDEEVNESHYYTEQDFLRFLPFTGIISLERAIGKYVNRVAKEFLDYFIQGNEEHNIPKI